MGGSANSGTGTAIRKAADDPRYPAVAQDPVELALVEIRDLTRVTTLQLMRNVGEIVFHRIFNADIELLRRNGPKEVSFRRLASHADLPMSAASLWRAVRTFELFEQHPRLQESTHLSARHVRAVLGLSAADQEELLVEADRRRWKLDKLEQAAKARRQGHGGRPPKSEIAKALDTLMRISALPVSVFKDRGALAKLTSDDVDTALETLSELEKRLPALRELLLELPRAAGQAAEAVSHGKRSQVPRPSSRSDPSPRVGGEKLERSSRYRDPIRS